MSGPRHDLLEITPEALTVLSNAGFVKRATRELTAGAGPQIEVSDDATVTARFGDGAATVLPPDVPVRDARCTCVASGMCRHRVLLVLAYQEYAGTAALDITPPAAPGASGQSPAAGEDADWSPADLGTGSLPAAVRTRATRLAAARPVVTVSPAQGRRPASVRLPMTEVTFLARGLGNARCDCTAGHGCEHVLLAVWAFQQAGGATAPTTFELAPVGHGSEGGAAGSRTESDPGAEVRDALLGLAVRLWWDGTAEVGSSLDRDVARVRPMIAGWAWVTDCLERVLDLVAAQEARSTRFDPVALLSAVAELTTRVEAAVRLGERASGGERPPVPPQVVLGAGVPGEVVLDRHRLVPLGARVWGADEEEGLEAWFADTDTMAVGVVRRSWALQPGAEAGVDVRRRRLSGATVQQLIGSQVLSQGTKRRAGGELVLPRAAHVFAVTPAAYEALRPPLRLSGDEVVEQLRTEAPVAVAAPGSGVRVVALDGGVPERAYDGAGQRLVLRGSSGGRDVRVVVSHDSLSPHALDAAARLAEGPLVAAVGTVAVVGEVVHVQARVLVGESGVLVLAAATAGDPVGMETLTDRGDDPVLAAVHDALAVLATSLRQGLRHVGPGGQRRLVETAERLREVGLTRTAGWLDEIAAGLGGSDRAGVVRRLAAVVSVLERAPNP